MIPITFLEVPKDFRDQFGIRVSQWFIKAGLCKSQTEFKNNINAFKVNDTALKDPLARIVYSKPDDQYFILYSTSKDIA